MPEEFRAMYNADDIELPPNFLGGHPFDTGSLDVRDEMLADFPRSPDETKRHIAEYYAMISHLDYQLGNVVKAVEEKGELENTIFIFAGDNGLALGQHGLFGKQNCYDHSVRVPLIFAGPRIPRGDRADALVYLYDVFPTICELIDIAVPDTVEGTGLREVMNDDSATVRDSIYFAYCEFQRAIRDSQYKLIEYVIDGKHIKTQLFNLINDPWELINLAENNNFSDKKRELRKKLVQYSYDWNDRDSKWGEIFWKNSSGRSWGI
jgi:arylsulfatase A-like enzyme